MALRLDKGLNGQGLLSAGTGLQAPRIKNQPNKAYLFPLVGDEMIWVLWKVKQLKKQNACLPLVSHMEEASDSVVLCHSFWGLLQKER